MRNASVDTLILSDVHLGSETSRAREATELLESMRFRRLILLGDIFSDLNFRRLQQHHWEFLSLVRKLSNPKRRIEVVWVEGNHDLGLSDVMSHMMGVRVYQEYAWTHEGASYLAIHGHQFDRFVVNNAVLSRVGEWFYLNIQKVDRNGNPIACWLDRLNSRWLRLTSKVSAGALAYARNKGAGVVFCGHTHHSHEASAHGVRYFNTGAWTHEQLTYVLIDERGPRICQYGSPAARPEQGVLLQLPENRAV
jgi:UDP-2,3-diacylglucosamine pyrophosphatase LpxH